MDVFNEIDISCEKWREYVTLDGYVYKIVKPIRLMLKEGSTSHRIEDSKGIWHHIDRTCYPILRWKGDLVV